MKEVVLDVLVLPFILKTEDISFYKVFKYNNVVSQELKDVIM